MDNVIGDDIPTEMYRQAHALNQLKIEMSLAGVDMSEFITGIPLSDLRDVVQKMNANHAEPLIVNNDAEADMLSSNDPLKNKWKTGDKYYRLELHGKTIPISPDI